MKTKRLLFIFILFSAAFAVKAQPKVKTGIEVLRDIDFAPLKGLRVGLVTNPTGVDHNLESTIDILANAPDVELVALYGPEHGVRGDIHAGDEVKDSYDPETGIKVYSIYGATRKPTPDMLKGIDVMVYDIQDIGCRSYTFISSLGLVMEACGEQGISVMVLDRPNPLGGLKVEGCLVEPGYVSFVSQFEIPYIYGLTVGELARMLNGEGLLRGKKGDSPVAGKCRLTVVPMQGWRREMRFSDTGLPWVPSSPHIPEATTTTFYPMSGILGELQQYIFTGVGYTQPFQLFGADWIKDPVQFADSLNALHLPGIKFRPVTVKPFYGSYKEKSVNGVQPYITDYDSLAITEVGFNVIDIVYRMYPNHPAFNVEWRKYRMFDLCLGTGKIRALFSRRHRFSDIADYWRKDADDFRKRSEKYYLY